jgi:predicted CopG family antitoxin
MKTLNETFTDEEYERLKRFKEGTGLSWHDFILMPVSVKKR